MGTLRETLRHAFAVDEPGAAEPTDEQRPSVEWFCMQVAKRGLATPAVVALEMSRPLNFLASQALHMFAPGVWAIARQQTHEQYKHFATFLERRGCVEYLANRIETLQEELEQKRKVAVAARRERKDEPPQEP